MTELERIVLRPLERQGLRFWLVVAGLVAVIAWGVYAYTVQLREGMVVTGMRDRVSWGLYVGTFVFFIGVSYGGTLVSAMLRLADAEWRRPITRIAEAITAFALIISGTMLLADLGRPDRALNLVLFGRLESPLVWDLLAISLYFVGSLIFLYLPLIPDLAILRDRMPPRARVRRWLYARLAVRWHGLGGQHGRLDRAIAVMTVLVIPLAVSAHTVTAWIFGMTLRVGWHSAILGPYFVVGAIFSGIATVILVVAILRRVFHLESLIRPVHFRNLGLLLLALDFTLIYFTLSEYLTAGYGAVSSDLVWLSILVEGPYAPLFWFMILGGFVAPAVILSLTRARSVGWTVVASVLVNVGMWFERYVIVVPALSAPQMPVGSIAYWPTWVEWSVMAGAFAGFALLLALFARLFPVVSIWEMASAALRRTPSPASAEAVE